MPITRAVGTTSEIINVYFRDNRNTSTVGMPNISSSSVGFAWIRNNQAAISSGTCSSNTVLGTYSTAALTQISSTSSLGWYQFGMPDGAFASGRSVVLKLRSAQAGVTPVDLEIDLLGSVAPVSVSTLTTPVGVSSASVDFGVSTIAVAQKLVGVSTIAAGEKLVGVSTIAAGEKLVGVSTIASDQKLVGVSSITALATSSIASGVWRTSTAADFGTSSSIGFSLYNAFEIGTTVYTASSLANAPTGGGGTPVGVSSISVLVGVSTLAVPVGVSSASVNLGVSTLAASVSSVTGQVGVSTIAVAEKLVGVSTIAVSEKLVGVSTIAAAQKLVGVSTIAGDQKLVGVTTLSASVSSVTGDVQVSSMAVQVGVSTFATSVDVSSMSVTVGVSTMATPVGVSSSIMVSSNTVQINGATVQGDGTAGDLWRG